MENLTVTELVIAYMIRIAFFFTFVTLFFLNLIGMMIVLGYIV